MQGRRCDPYGLRLAGHRLPSRGFIYMHTLSIRIGLRWKLSYSVIVIFSAISFDFSFPLRDAHLGIRSLAGDGFGRAPLMPFSV